MKTKKVAKEVQLQSLALRKSLLVTLIWLIVGATSKPYKGRANPAKGNITKSSQEAANVGFSTALAAVGFKVATMMTLDIETDRERKRRW